MLPVRNVKLQTVSIPPDFLYFLVFYIVGPEILDNRQVFTITNNIRGIFLPQSELKFSDPCDGLHALCYEVDACILLAFTGLWLNYLAKVTKINSFIVSS